MDQSVAPIDATTLLTKIIRLFQVMTGSLLLGAFFFPLTVEPTMKFSWDIIADWPTTFGALLMISLPLMGIGLIVIGAIPKVPLVIRAAVGSFLGLLPLAFMVFDDSARPLRDLDRTAGGLGILLMGGLFLMIGATTARAALTGVIWPRIATGVSGLLIAAAYLLPLAHGDQLLLITIVEAMSLSVEPDALFMLLTLLTPFVLALGAFVLAGIPSDAPAVRWIAGFVALSASSWAPLVFFLLNVVVLMELNKLIFVFMVFGVIVGSAMTAAAVSLSGLAHVLLSPHGRTEREESTTGG